MTYNNERHRRRNPNDPTRRSASFGRKNMLPLIVAAVIAIALIAVIPLTTTERVNDTNNAGPSVQTVTPAPSPSTSPTVPTPNPTTEQPNTTPAQ